MAKNQFEILDEPGPVVRQQPKVFITSDARRRLDAYIKAAPGEVGGLGTVRRVGSDFLITGVYLLEQVASGAELNLEPAVMARFQIEMMRSGVPSESFKLCWHSHADFNVFWSPQDERGIEMFNRVKWMVSIVGNKAGDWTARIDLFEPVHITVYGVPFEVLVEEDKQLTLELAAEVRAKVRRPPPKVKKDQKCAPLFRNDMTVLSEFDTDSTFGDKKISSQMPMRKASI